MISGLLLYYLFVLIISSISPIINNITAVNRCGFVGLQSRCETKDISSAMKFVGKYCIRTNPNERAHRRTLLRQAGVSLDGVLYSKDRTALVAYPNRHNSSYSVLDSVTRIGSGAFKGCSGLTSVTILDSVTEIGWDAFKGCLNLTVYCSKDSRA